VDDCGFVDIPRPVLWLPTGGLGDGRAVCGFRSGSDPPCVTGSCLATDLSVRLFPHTRTSRSGGRDLIGALTLTLRVLSAVPAGGANRAHQTKEGR
jgi:hypothetical protein